MENYLGAFHGPGESLHLKQISGYGLSPHCPDSLLVLHRARKSANAISSRNKPAHHASSQHARRSSNKNVHGVRLAQQKVQGPRSKVQSPKSKVQSLEGILGVRYTQDA